MNRLHALPCILLLTACAAHAQPRDPASSSHELMSWIEQLAGEMETEIVVDPRFPRALGTTTAGDAADYESLLAMLRINGYFALETAEQILILPEAAGRSAPTRLLQEDDTSVSDHEIVTRIITVTGIEATQMIPVLRPMMSQSAQLGSVTDSHSLIVVDRYDNVRRMTRVVEEIVARTDD